MAGNNDKQVVTQQTSSENEPWSPAQPFLKQVIGDAESSYGSGGFEINPFEGSTVSDRSAQTQSSLDQIQGIAEAGTPVFGNALNSLSNITDSGGMQPGQQGAADTFGRIAQGGYRPEQMPGIQGLMETASGQNSGQNGALDQVISRAADQMRTSSDQSFGQAGRYGSGQHAKVMGDSIGAMTSNLLANQYNQDRSMETGAQQALVGAGQSQDNLAASAAGGLNSVFRGANADTMSAAGMLPQAYAAQTMPADMLGTVGAQEDNRNALNLQDQMNKWYATQNAPFDAISRGMAIGGGAGSIGGTSNGTVLSPDNSPSTFESVLGGGLGLAGLFGGF